MPEALLPKATVSRAWLAAAALLFATHPLIAQGILMTPPSEPVIPQILREATSPAPASRPPAPPETPFRLGPFAFHPRLSYGYTAAEGLPAPDGRRVASEIHRISGGVTADLGRRWTLDYSPTWLYYTARAMEDSFDQSVTLSGAASIQDWNFTFSEGYSASTPMLVETGRQTEQESWSTNLGAFYSISPSLQLQASGGMNERYADPTPMTRGWSGQVRASWQYSPRLSLSFGPGFNYTEIADAADTYGESYTGQLSWRPVNKLNVSLDGGMQYTHSKSASAVDLSNPILNLSLGYQPFETTSVSLALSRTVSTSYFKDQVTEDVRWNLGVQQRLLGHVYLSASYSRYKNDYTATNALADSLRKDVVEAFSTRLSTKLLGRIGVSVSFQENKNKSNVAAFSFSSKQYGLELNWQF